MIPCDAGKACLHSPGITQVSPGISFGRNGVCVIQKNLFYEKDIVDRHDSACHR